MLYLGVDQALGKPGCAIVDKDGKVVRSTVLSVGQKLRGAVRLQHILRQLRAFVGEGTHLVSGALEGPSLKSVHREFDLGEISGAVRMGVLDAYALELVVVPPTSLKKFVTGHGGSDKDAMIYFVKARWGVTCADDNEADAVGLAQFARAHHRHEFRLRTDAEAVLALARPPRARKRPLPPKTENI